MCTVTECPAASVECALCIEQCECLSRRSVLSVRDSQRVSHEPVAVEPAVVGALEAHVAAAAHLAAHLRPRVGGPRAAAAAAGDDGEEARARRDDGVSRLDEQVYLALE